MLAAAAPVLCLSGAAQAQDVSFRVGAATSGGPTLAAFWILAALTLAGALATITRRNPVTAAVCLVGTLVSSAGLYLLLHATFLAVMQVLVYAGAVMVLFVLVVMAVDRPEQEESGLLRGGVTKLVGVAAMVWFLLRAGRVLMGPEVRLAGPVPPDFGTVTSIGKLLFSDLLFPFEAISLLLLVAVVGAVVVTRGRAARAAASDESEPRRAA